MPGKGVLKADVVVVLIRLLLGRKANNRDRVAALGVLPNIGQEEVELPVAVVVEEEGRRRMPFVIETRPLGNVRKVPVALVAKENIAHAHVGDVQVGCSVVV